jgi:hypothetical protein
MAVHAFLASSMKLIAEPARVIAPTLRELFSHRCWARCRWD